MPRKNTNYEDGKTGGSKCNIRKRGCSSSSSSSLVHNYRLKRAILVAKRRGSNTPMPTWKMSTSMHLMHSNDNKASTGMGKEASILSARKLAATLWEINEVPSNNMYNNLKDRGSRVDMCRGKVSKSSKLGPMALPDLSHSHVGLKSMDRERRKSVDLRGNEFANDNNLRGSDSHGNATLEKVKAQPNRQSVGTKSRLKDISQGLMTSKELLKVLVHICELDKQNSTSKSLVTGLKFEIDCAHAKVENLIQEQQCDHKEADYLLKQFAEERLAWKTKEKERMDVVIKSIVGELEVQKKLRKQSERLNKKLGKELETTKLCLSKAEKAVGNEKREREILEQVCDELARGIGEDRAEVEKEREMLQVADDLREARVQMKLSEAKFQFEEKNAAVEKLRSELESCLRAEKVGENGEDNVSYDYDDGLQVMQACQLQEDKERDVSPDSDVQSIELNLENNGKAYGWNFCDEKMGRNSIMKKEICLERQMSDAIEWEFSTKLLEDDSGGLTSKERFVKFTSKVRKEGHDDEIRRYKLIKDLRDHIVSGNSGLALLQEAA